MEIGKRAEACASVFKERASKAHSNKYDYSLVNYVKAVNKVIIICPIHGEFTKTPNKHLAGQGCPECTRKKAGNILTKSFDDFLIEANTLHGNRYTYSEETYSNSKNKMTIICPEHGEFLMSPDKHLNRGSGCPECIKRLVRESTRKDIEEFIIGAKAVHGDIYDYSKVEYTNSHTDVTIVCPIHGEFQQTPSNHLSGKGCKHCQPGGGFDRNKAGKVYYLSIDNGKYYKVGITNRDVWKRFSKGEHHRIRIIKEWEYPLGKEAQRLEAEIIAAHKDKLVPPNTKILRNGNTEIFSEDVLGLDDARDTKMKEVSDD